MPCATTPSFRCINDGSRMLSQWPPSDTWTRCSGAIEDEASAASLSDTILADARFRFHEQPCREAVGDTTQQQRDGPFRGNGGPRRATEREEQRFHRPGCRKRVCDDTE